MYCPICHQAETKVIDSRMINDGSQVRRRRECAVCNERFTSYESYELFMPKIIKRDGQRCTFDEDKLRRGINRALEKRPVSAEAYEAGIERLKQRLSTYSEREIASNLIGEWVMEELRKLDAVAYVRFASVYRCFTDVRDFSDAIAQLKQDPHDHQ